MLLGLGRRLVSAVALIHISQLDALDGGLLDGSGWLLDLCSLSTHRPALHEGEQVPKGVHCAVWVLEPLLRLAPS